MLIWSPTKLIHAAALPLLALQLAGQPAPDGRKLFTAHCSSCHGADGQGGEHGPAIVGAARSDQNLRDLIHTGLPERGMPGFSLPAGELDQLAAFVRSLLANAKSVAPATAPVRPLPSPHIPPPRPATT